jgi:LAS superfamily LD-carboxypeptidase LdcB
MVGFMRWVHKKSLLFLVAVLIPALCGSIYFLSNLRTTKFQGSVTFIQPKPRIICFNSNELKTTMTLVESATANGVVSEIHPLLLTRFKTAAAFAKADGIKLFITSGFRTLDRQAFLFNREVEIRGSESEAAKWVLPPQYSHHPRGLAIDVNYPGDRLGALWLEENGSRFGLCRVYANEWWHFEGVIAPGQACPPLAPNALVDLK